MTPFDPQAVISPERKRLLCAIVQRVEVADSGCFNWTGYNGGDDPRLAYGKLYVGNKRVRRAHQLMYELFRGQIPSGLQLDHLCRNTLCVNPDHLEPVTIGENVRRGNGPTAINAKKTHCPKGHPYSAENTTMRKGSRFCLECIRIRSRERHHQTKILKARIVELENNLQDMIWERDDLLEQQSKHRCEEHK